MSLPTINDVLTISNKIDSYVDLIPARYYCPEDGVTKKGVRTSEAVAKQTKKRNKKAPINDPKLALSKNELREKLLAKIKEVKDARQAKKDGKKRKRGEKRALEDDVTYANFVDKDAETQEETGPSSKKHKLEKDIRNIERREAKINKMDDIKERAGAKHSDKMEKALRRAGGIKIRDNVSKLKKTLKTKEKQKSKGKEEWKERVQDVKKKNADKQVKRKENIQKYRTKKGKRKNGFEGQKGEGFINKDKET